MSDSEFCDFVKDIQKDPFKQITGLSIRKFYQLQAHIKQCQECLRITDEILEKKPKNTPEDPNNGWNKVNYN
jgi:hypothetical protein